MVVVHAYWTKKRWGKSGPSIQRRKCTIDARDARDKDVSLVCLGLYMPGRLIIEARMSMVSPSLLCYDWA